MSAGAFLAVLTCFSIQDHIVALKHVSFDAGPKLYFKYVSGGSLEAYPSTTTPQRGRYSPNWQGKDGDWRRDFLWVQEYEENNGRSAGASTLNGKRVGQLQLIVSVRDHERQINSKGKRKSAVYTGALIDILRGGCPHEIHGMVEVQRYQDVPSSRLMASHTCIYY
jgi:hypothetical protein